VAASADCLAHIAMLAPVLREIRGESLLVTLVVGASLGGMFSRMPLPPTTHGLARFFGIASDPLAPVLPPTVDIFEWHAGY
jgi:hypothetical protein